MLPPGWRGPGGGGVSAADALIPGVLVLPTHIVMPLRHGPTVSRNNFPHPRSPCILQSAVLHIPLPRARATRPRLDASAHECAPSALRIYERRAVYRVAHRRQRILPVPASQRHHPELRQCALPPSVPAPPQHQPSCIAGAFALQAPCVIIHLGMHTPPVLLRSTRAAHAPLPCSGEASLVAVS